MSRTLLDIRSQVKDDLDINEENFVTDVDLNRFINDAIEMAEAEIHTLYEDYYMANVDIPIALGESLIDYPVDIYANKIRKIIFKEGAFNTAIYEVKKEKNIMRAESADEYNQSSTSDLSWMPVNNTGVGRKIRLYPKTGRSGILTVYYIRNAQKLALDADICDIDEFEQFIIQATKTMVYLKDGDPRAVDSKALEDALKVSMVTTLSEMVPDGNSEIDLDTSHYDDSVGDY